jgi:glycogen synthase kinase 3 beta
MKSFYFAPDGEKLFLNMVMEYVPQTIYSVCRYFLKQRKALPSFYVKVLLPFLFPSH